MSEPLFSVVTPVRNGMPQLRRCVGSVRAQAGVPVEHVVQDALSTDGSRQWLQVQPDLMVESASDDGMYDALNKGFARTRGSVLSWLNADEQYLPGALATAAEAFRARPEVDIVFGDALLVDASGHLVAARREIPLREAYVSGTFLYALSCTMFFRRRLLDAGDLVLNPGRRIAGDLELLLSLLRKRRKAHHLPRYLALFTIDGRNLSRTPEAQGEYDAVLGPASSRIPRTLALAARRLEKGVRGCYRRLPVTYDWAEDETPTYRRFTYDRAPTRFQWDRFDPPVPGAPGHDGRADGGQ